MVDDLSDGAREGLDPDPIKDVRLRIALLQSINDSHFANRLKAQELAEVEGERASREAERPEEHEHSSEQHQRYGSLQRLHSKNEQRFLDMARSMDAEIRENQRVIDQLSDWLANAFKEAG
jgi:hypothetical protein